MLYAAMVTAQMMYRSTLSLSLFRCFFLLSFSLSLSLSLEKNSHHIFTILPSPLFFFPPFQYCSSLSIYTLSVPVCVSPSPPSPSLFFSIAPPRLALTLSLTRERETERSLILCFGERVRASHFHRKFTFSCFNILFLISLPKIIKKRREEFSTPTSSQGK